MLPSEHIGHTIMNNDEGKSRTTFCLPTVLLDTYFNNLPLASSTSYIMWCVFLHYIAPAEQNWLLEKWRNPWRQSGIAESAATRYIAPLYNFVQITQHQTGKEQSNKKSLWAQSLSLGARRMTQNTILSFQAQFIYVYAIPTFSLIRCQTR
jgi:hypothetical protein